MKYGLIAAVIAVVALFYFMSQSNKADAERLKQAEIAHQQKLEQDKANEANLEQASLTRQAEAEKAKVLKAEQATNAQLKQVADNEKQKSDQKASEIEEFKKYQQISDKWMAQEVIASSTARVAVSGPVTELRKIRDELKSTPITGCLSGAKEKLLLAMEDSILSFVYFMQNDAKSTKKAAELKISYFNNLTEALTIYTPCKDKYGS